MQFDVLVSELLKCGMKESLKHIGSNISYKFYYEKNYQNYYEF